MVKKQKPNIGIIGAGFVGGAISRGFSLTANVKIYDKDPKRSVDSFEDVCNSEFIFLCLPTPMEHVEGGKADLSILQSVLKSINNNGANGIIILKSTIPIGTTDKFVDQYPDLKIIHNPEFLTARNADIDFITPARTILGGHFDLTKHVAHIFSDRFPGTNILRMTSNESEAVKYIANCFFAVKIMYFNEVFLGLKNHGLDWDTVMDGVLTDGRIGVSHCDVPGHDGHYGYGGSCVLPDAQVKLEKSPGEYYMCSIKEMFDEFKNTWKIEGSNAALDSVIFKGIKAVTETPSYEDLYEFYTNNGVFTCTGDHLIPIQREGEKIVISAKEIKDTDRLFIKTILSN